MQDESAPPPYRPAFAAALGLFARASEDMKALGFLPPVLVGGAAVEFYSGSTISTGDFDIVTARQDQFEDILRKHGFVGPSGPGKATRGWIHPDLQLGFEVVSSSLLDGMADRDRIVMVRVGTDGFAAFVSLEDMVADRMGQYASGSAPDMLDQARTLYRLYSDADRAYMDARIRHETAGDYGIEALDG